MAMNTSLTIYLVRHAQSHNNAQPDAQRVSDPAITKLGQLQAAKLASRVKDEFSNDTLDGVLCSPFLRTLQTIQPAVQELPIKPRIWTQLFEAGGCYDGHEPGRLKAKSGMTRSEIAAKFPEFSIPEDIDEKGWYRSKGFEQWHEASLRAKQQAARLVDEHFGHRKSVLCMIHGDLIALLLSHFHPGNPVLSETNVTNTSITALRFDQRDAPPVVLSHNDTSHLQASEISY